MSQETVQFVRAGFDEWIKGDMDAYRDLLDPDFVMHGPPTSMEMSCVYLVQNERMQRMDFFLDHAEALAALGLRNPGPSPP